MTHATTENPVHTAVLPPSANWPKALKQLTLASLGARMTWDLWARPFTANSDEPAWVLLRSCARQIARVHRVLDSDDAWNICMRYVATVHTSRRAA